MEKLSVVIITFNEAHRIKRCIDSVLEIADEIVVVDSFSTDDTIAIAKSLGANVIQEKFRGYVEQKNFALTMAKEDWILSLDADEAIDDTLKNEIKTIKKQDLKTTVFQINRFNCYCGKWINHGAWNPDLKIRIFKSNTGKWEGLNPHDRFQPKAEVHIEKLKGQILHWSYDSVEGHREKIQKFALIGAEAYFKAGKKAYAWQTIFSPLVRFFRDYFLKAGILDGKEGFIIAWLTAKEVRLKYQYLRELNTRSTIQQKSQRL